MVAQFVRDQQRRQRFGKARQVLRHVDQRDREIARRVQHRQAERAGEHHVAGRDLALLPEGIAQASRPMVSTTVTSAWMMRSRSRYRGCAGVRSFRDRSVRVEAAMLAARAAERPHQRHVADHVDHFAVDRRGLVGEFVMQRLPGARQAEHDDDHDAADRPRASRPSARSWRATNAIAATVAAQGGSTFQMNMFSTVYTASTSR